MRRLLSLFVGVLLSAVLVSQDARELSTPTGQLAYVGVGAATINAAAASGYRLTDLHYRGSVLGIPSFDCAMVQNTGPYAIGWWWYYGQTGAQVSALLTANQARLIDLEPYDNGAGSVVFACVMVDNTGVNARGWYWLYNTTVAGISSLVSTGNARIIDLNEYAVGGTVFYSAVFIVNAGADARSWWWYVNATPAQVSSFINVNQARLYCLEPLGNGNFNVVMIRDVSPAEWYWWYGLASSDILYLLTNYGVRIVDLESYVIGGVRYYAMATINNSNALSTQVGDLMRGDTDGQVGCWLQHMNGANLAYLNGDTVFEPASGIKVLINTHAMRQVLLGNTSLATNINVFTGTIGSCPQDTGPVSESLLTVLQLMMRNSDNNRTQACQAFFGRAAINATGAALGMGSTSINHRLGCGADAIANPDHITLRDLNTLHEQVVNGYLGIWRPTFYDIMLHSVNDLSIASVIDQEAAAIGGFSPTTVATFKGFTHVAHKGGSYGLSTGGPLFFHRSEFGWLSLPFVVRGALVDREYGFGAYVNNASNDTNAAAAIYTHALPELLRGQVHAALASWTAAQATVTSLGVGCAGFAQSAIGLPRLNTSTDYRGTGGFPGALAVLGIGFSNTLWSGLALPASLASFGGAGCFAYNDVISNRVTFASVTGQADINIGMPNNPDLLGVAYYTQFYSFGTGSLRSTNSLHSTIGL